VVTDVPGFSDAEHKAIANGAYRAYQVGRGYLELSDCQQEAWLWVVENEEKVDELRERGKSGISSLEQHAYKAALAHVRYVQQANNKTRPQDYATYDVNRIQDMLPAVFLGESFNTGQMVNEEIKSTIAPNEGGNWLVSIVDVERAFKQLTQEQKQLLFAIHSDAEATYKTVGDEFELTEAQVRRREVKAIEAMIDYLGGPKVEREYQRERRRDRDMR
jgi:hypothetical protein